MVLLADAYSKCPIADRAMALFEIGENLADGMPRSDGPGASAVIIAQHGSGPDNGPEALAALICQPGFDAAM